MDAPLTQGILGDIHAERGGGLRILIIYRPCLIHTSYMTLSFKRPAEPEWDRRALRAQVLHRDDGALRRRMVQAAERRARAQVRHQFLLSFYFN